VNVLAIRSFMQQAVDIAVENVKTGHGGPFGAIVVKDGIVVGVGKNEVTASNDPTAHAEVQAIRDACKRLETFQLTDCEMYTSCEPCPMCLGAIYWARPKAVYFVCSKEDAKEIGFDDQFIYEELKKPMEERSILMKKVSLEHGDRPFRLWEQSNRKIEY
jgi:guanine deaminase